MPEALRLQRRLLLVFMGFHLIDELQTLFFVGFLGVSSSKRLGEGRCQVEEASVDEPEALEFGLPLATKGEDHEGDQVPVLPVRWKGRSKRQQGEK